jgi:hypothetical protein
MQSALRVLRASVANLFFFGVSLRQMTGHRQLTNSLNNLVAVT